MAIAEPEGRRLTYRITGHVGGQFGCAGVGPHHAELRRLPRSRSKRGGRSPPSAGLRTVKPSRAATLHRFLSEATRSEAAPQRSRSSATDNCIASSVRRAQSTAWVRISVKVTARQQNHFKTTLGKMRKEEAAQLIERCFADHSRSQDGTSSSVKAADTTTLVSRTTRII